MNHELRMSCSCGGGTQFRKVFHAADAKRGLGLVADVALCNGSGVPRGWSGTLEQLQKAKPETARSDLRVFGGGTLGRFRALSC